MIREIVIAQSGHGGIDWSDAFDPGLVVPTVMFIMVGVGIVAGAWVKVARSRHEMELKRSMIERGMTPEEIERVLGAKKGKD